MPAAAGKVKGVAEIELKTDRFIRPAEDVKRSLGGMEQKAKTTYQSVGTAADGATGKMVSGAQKSKAAFTGMGNAAQSATPKIQRTTEAINMSRIAAIGSTAAFVGMGASFIGLSASLVNIPKRITDVQKTVLDLSKTTLALDRERANVARIESELTKAREDGIKSAEEITRMEQERVFVLRNMDDIANDLLIKEEELIQKQDELNHAWLLTGSAVAMTVLSGGAAIMMMLTSMATQVGKTTGQFVAFKLSIIANSNALKILMPNIQAARAQLTLMRGTLMASGAAFAATGTKMSIMNIGLKTLGHGFKALYLAMGPVGWAITAITIAIEAFEHNLGGFRDALSWIAGKELPSFTDAMGGAAKKADALRDSMSLLQDEFDLTAAQMLELRGVIKEYNKDLDTQIEKEKAADFEELRKKIGLTAEQMEHVKELGYEMQQSNKAAADSTNDLNTELNTLGTTASNTGTNIAGMQTQIVSFAKAMDGALVPVGSLEAQLGEMFESLNEGDRLQDIKDDAAELVEALIRGSHAFEPGSPEYNLFLDGMVDKIKSTESVYDTAFGEGAMMERVRTAETYSRGWKNIFQDIQKHAIDTGKVIDNIGQKKTTLETNLRDLEGTERMLAHLNNMRIREVKGQNFWRDNVVNGGGDAIQQSENYYDSYVKNKGQNQLGMGNWSSVDSGKPGFSPIKWVQNQGSNLEYRRQKEARERLLARSVGIAENLGWSYRRRYGRENIVHYFRGKQSRALGFVNETKRRASLLGVDVNRNTNRKWDEFQDDVDAWNKEVGLDRDRVQNWRLTQHGYEQLLAMRAFNERAMLEGELAV